MVWALADWLMPIAGLGAGTVLGAVARAHRFCTMSALERHWFAADSTGLRSWVLAAASALIVTQALQLAGLIDVSAAFYLTSGLSLAGAILGGIAFGFGMALTGTCGFGALVRVGGGSLRSLMVLLALGLSALAVQRGVLAPLRINIGAATAIDLQSFGGQSIATLAANLTGLDIALPITLLIIAAMLYWVFRERSYRSNIFAIATGTTIGTVVAFGWFVTSWGQRNLFEPVQLEAGSFVLPVGDLLMHITAYAGAPPDYGVGLVVGVVLGAMLVARLRNEVRWEACDDARELGRHLSGAMLMGVGGIFAMGCTIGQGVAAVSVLAISAPVVLLSMALGAKMGLAHLFEGSPWRAFSSVYRDPAE